VETVKYMEGEGGLRTIGGSWRMEDGRVADDVRCGRWWIMEGGWRMRRGGQWLTDGEGREVLGGRLTMEAGVNADGG
jgi:hypothetical protein